MAVPPKSATAFRTIGEVSRELGVPQHVLRYWEGRFPQIRPLQRAGNRRHYRPEDIAVLRRIDRLLNSEGYSIRGAQKVLEDDVAIPPSVPVERFDVSSSAVDPHIAELRDIRALLSASLRDDDDRMLDRT